MTSLIPEKGLAEQKKKIESLAQDVMLRLQSRYGVPASGLYIGWEDCGAHPFGRFGRVADGVLYLNQHELVDMPYDKAVRETPVTLSLRTSEGEIEITFPYDKVMNWLYPSRVPAIFEIDRPALTDVDIKAGITEVVVTYVVEQMGGWLATEDTNARCLKNGIIKSYGHIMAETMPTAVTANIWNVHDPGLQSWRETEGGFTLLYPHLKDYLYGEVINLIRDAGPPVLRENLPDYVTRVLEPLY